MGKLGVIATLLGVASGCGFDLVPRDTPGLHVEWLVDASGSYPALPHALDAVCRTVEQLRGSDRLSGRFITERSYSARAVFVDVELPNVKTGGGFESPEALVERRAGLARLDSLRCNACRALPRAAAIRRASRTDLIGGIAAVAGAFRSDASGRTKVLFIASDLEDNVDPGDVTIALTGVVVRFVAVESRHGTLEDIERHVQRWTDALRSMGASDVSLLPPGAVPDLAALRVSARGQRGT